MTDDALDEENNGVGSSAGIRRKNGFGENENKSFSYCNVLLPLQATSNLIAAFFCLLYILV